MTSPDVLEVVSFFDVSPETSSYETRLKFSKSASFAASAASDAATARSHRRDMSSSYLPLGAPRRNGRYRACPTPKRANTALCSNAVRGDKNEVCASDAKFKKSIESVSVSVSSRFSANAFASRGASSVDFRSSFVVRLLMSLGSSMAAASTRDSPTSNVSRSAAACAHVNARSRRACSSASRRSRGVKRRDPTSRNVAAKVSSS
mmetsp:Transcript_3897/g.16568  ORF Transcript_3897/g.16568 Transcript_3897/m.16568 type:complete len:205 (+) Transcript_3897:631-1245(+)